MDLLMLFDRRDTCPTCPLRTTLVSHLQARYKDQKQVFRLQQISTKIAADYYPKSGCACLVSGSEPPIKYRFETRSDAPCNSRSSVRIDAFKRHAQPLADEAQQPRI